MFQLVRMADKGRLPVAGGVLDQAEAFVEAMELIEHDRSQWDHHG